MPPRGDSLLPATDAALLRIHALVLPEHSMETLLQAIVDETRALLPGHVDASISVLIGSRPATAAYSGQLALDLDETQYARGHGPCLHAALTGEPVDIGDVRTETRWPDYAQRAVERGSLSSYSLPLPVDGLRAGMNVYATEAHGIDDDARAPVRSFTGTAAAAIGNLHELQTAQDIVANLEVALSSRAVIEQAKGILMQRMRLTADQAFQYLVHASQAANVKLRDVADHLVRTGEVLQPDQRRR